MAHSRRFSIGFLKVTDNKEEVFVSVTPGFEHGPGILRDGITSPSMTDPHTVPFVCHSRGIQTKDRLPRTTDAYVQRAGTWTLYKHLKEFDDKLGKKGWRIVGVQSCGDLTMNPWHTAYIRKSYLWEQEKLCGLMTENDDREPITSRIYRCVVKWKSDVASKIGSAYDTLDLRFAKVARGCYTVTINDTARGREFHRRLSVFEQYSKKTMDISSLIDFSLSGKPLVEDQVELSLSNAIDRFQDIRHVFNLPEVKSKAANQREDVPKINFGEYQLFKNLNERRAALSSAVIIDLNIGDRVEVTWEDVRARLLDRHFKEVTDSPMRRGQFRRYQDDINQDRVEIFFPHNVYPFGVLGTHEHGLTYLASGGLSGRVGNTLEGITRIMYDFFGCDDAMVLDEGLDTFQIVNPEMDSGEYKYTNREILKKVLSFTKKLTDIEHQRSLDSSADYYYAGGMKKWPLNTPLVEEIEKDFAEGADDDHDEILNVEPQRTQVRSVLILAAKQNR